MKKKEGPNLDRYISSRRRYVTYIEGYRLYSIPYYSFVKLVKEANANLIIRKKALVDLNILDEYLKQYREVQDAEEEKKC